MVAFVVTQGEEVLDDAVVAELKLAARTLGYDDFVLTVRESGSTAPIEGSQVDKGES